VTEQSNYRAALDAGPKSRYIPGSVGPARVSR
jgi:hypothetical protein